MKKRLLLTIFHFIIIFITLTFVSVLFLMNFSNNLLRRFKILEAYHTYNTFYLKYERVKAADYYKIEIMDNNANIIYVNDTNDTDLTFICDNMKYDTSYSLNVYAYDIKGNYRIANNSYEFTFKDPTFLKDNLLLNNDDYTIDIHGDLNEKDYLLSVYIDNLTIVNEVIHNNSYILSKDNYYNQEKEVFVTLTSNGVLVDSMTLFNDMNPISDIVIETPTNDSSIIYNDVSVIFHGGDNAKEYILNLYKGNILDRTFTTHKKKIILSSDIFNTDKNYRLDIIGVYGDYTKSSSVSFNITGRDKLKPVYINVNPRNIKKNTRIELKQPDNANIYYTLNGDDPNTSGILYKEPIVLDESCTLKTVAKDTLKDNSIVSTYELNVEDINGLKVYISPSNQGANQGVHEVGFTTEKIEMNNIADYLINTLKQYENVTVYRNNPLGDINQWNNDANYLGVDIKLAIHSNASTNHTSYGTETWIDSEESDTYSFASLLQDAIIDMYPYKERDGYNRGVKYAHGEIGEANDMYVRHGLLIEVAHHDDLQDARWMKNNEKEIGEKMAEVILKYFQII